MAQTMGGKQGRPSKASTAVRSTKFGVCHGSPKVKGDACRQRPEASGEKNGAFEIANRCRIDSSLGEFGRAGGHGRR
jgi:hypothetical protein